MAGWHRAAQVMGTLVVLVVAASCASDSATSSPNGSLSPSVPAPSGSSGPDTTEPPGTFVPASGTTHSGLLFEEFHNAALGYHLPYPGDWHVTRKGTTVRIAKFGNAIVIAQRASKTAPKPKGVKAALEKQVKKGNVLSVTAQPRSVKLTAGTAVRLVYTQARPASDTSPAATLAVYRYILFHAGKVYILSLQSPEQFDNRAPFKLIVNGFGWG
ncbi:MAG: hypothetical protein QOJ31_681 [Gaiellales bacterium]|nr:hypothetical protein [Gaiellales bacterium]MDX6545572.1 hypothetical protein [Gaiellales bacterium]MDX6549997.1 hypothetical protein [Gaiellales bacterium]